MDFSFAPEEFLVEEVLPSGEVLELDKPFAGTPAEGRFSHFVLQKRLWDTPRALLELAKALRISRKRLNCAGNKDRNALTTQRCSAFAVRPEEFSRLKMKDLQILGAWNAADKVALGALAGNRFTLTLTESNTGRAIDVDSVKKRAGENGGLFPNLFGPQRFGSLRRNTHLVGKLLVQGKLKEAVWNYLTFMDEREKADSREARARFAEEKDFSGALSYYPLHLKFERTLIAHLHAYKNDYAGALRKLPRSLSLLFLHAYQSHLFNELLTARLKDGSLFEASKGDFYCKADPLGFPDQDKTAEITSQKTADSVNKLIPKGKAFLVANVLGYESEPTKDEAKLLKREGVKTSDFKLSVLPELSSKGTRRALFAPLQGFEVLREAPLQVRFSLPAGSYATVALAWLLGEDTQSL